ncbi:hypothetical protein CPLU01_01270 [Colletotrichum plurivorum]|uniref:Uncharacterized protein n=1 Tax=Colletotrichum plurivorum TaxID=2175906 RepID=A0A8H6U4P3_9PEZI|nr:hypothetical protein CPLU01_01270 [Colletotrichum plurivorum]
MSPLARGGSLRVASGPVARSNASYAKNLHPHQSAIRLWVCGCWGEAEMAQQDLDVRPLAAKPSRSAQLAKRVWRTADSEAGMGPLDLGLQTGRQEADITPDDYGTPWPSDRNHDLAGPDLVTHAPPNPVPASSPAPNPTAGHQGDGRLAAVGPGQHEASGGTTTTTNAWYTSLGRSLRPRPRPPVNTTADMDKTNKQPRRQGGMQEDRQAGS